MAFWSRRWRNEEVGGVSRGTGRAWVEVCEVVGASEWLGGHEVGTWTCRAAVRQRRGLWRCGSRAAVGPLKGAQSEAPVVAQKRKSERKAPGSSRWAVAGSSLWAVGSGQLAAWASASCLRLSTSRVPIRALSGAIRAERDTHRSGGMGGSGMGGGARGSRAQEVW